MDGASLPALGDPSPTSNPNLEASGPEGWKRLRRDDDKYLIGWYGGSNANILPRILVKSAEWTGEAGETTPENLVALRKEIEKSLKANNNVIEKPQAMLLGGKPWVRYVEEAQTGGKKAEQQILQRVVAGKKYIVELQIYPGLILKSRDQAYAVAAGLEFKPPAAAAPGESEAPADANQPTSVEPPDATAAPVAPAAEGPENPKP